MSDSDLKDELDDYFKEFESIPNFDNEVCPTCGASNFDSCEFPLDNFILLTSYSSSAEAEKVSNLLRKEKVVHQLSLETVAPEIWNIMVMSKDKNIAQKIISNNK